MRYSERKEFLFDTELFGLYDTQNALRIYAEFVKKGSPKPCPTFFVVDRSDEAIDDLWHMPLTDRTVFHRELQLPVLVKFERPDWRLTRLGITPLQKFKFILANLHLHPVDQGAKDEQLATGQPAIRLDYFPQRGDQIFYIGYRLMITKVVPEPESYWGQTNVWLGLIVEASIAPEGDAPPLADLSKAVPAELPGAQPRPDWPQDPPTGPVEHTYP
jgi:hypothetical protein